MLFRGQLEMMIEDTAHWNGGAWSDQTVVEGSAFDLTKIAGRRRFDSGAVVWPWE